MKDYHTLACTNQHWATGKGRHGRFLSRDQNVRGRRFVRIEQVMEILYNVFVLGSRSHFLNLIEEPWNGTRQRFPHPHPFFLCSD